MLAVLIGTEVKADAVVSVSDEIVPKQTLSSENRSLDQNGGKICLKAVGKVRMYKKVGKKNYYGSWSKHGFFSDRVFLCTLRVRVQKIVWRIKNALYEEMDQNIGVFICTGVFLQYGVCPDGFFSDSRCI